MKRCAYCGQPLTAMVIAHIVEHEGNTYQVCVHAACTTDAVAVLEHTGHTITDSSYCFDLGDPVEVEEE